MASSGPGPDRIPGRALRSGGLRGALPGYVRDCLGLLRGSAGGPGAPGRGGSVNHEADALANAGARRIGPSLHQQERYDARLTFFRAVQKAQSTILDAAQRGGSATPGGDHNRRRFALVGDLHTRERARGGPIRDLQGGEMRTWGPHLVVASEGGGVQVHPLLEARYVSAGQEGHGQAVV